MARDEFDSSHLVWFLAGIGVGAATALLLAPQSGRETRRMLVQGAERGREYLSEQTEDVRERSRELYERGRDAAEDAAERGRKLYERGRGVAEDATEHGRKIIHG